MPLTHFRFDVSYLAPSTAIRVSCLTTAVLILASIFLSSCSTLHPPSGATAASFSSDCKNRAFVHLGLADYVSTRFHSQAPVRMAIIPFSVAANLSSHSTQRPGLGNELAWQIRSELVRNEAAPIIEVLNRHDWPGKRDEFFVGNHGAIALSREAGYDLVLVGLFETGASLDHVVLHSKLIDTSSGITVWNGRSTVTRGPSLWHRTRDWLDLQKTVPSGHQFQPLMESLVNCAVRGILSEEFPG